MNSIRCNKVRIRALLTLTVVLLVASVTSCLSQVAQSYVPNQLIVTLQPGSTPEDMQRIADANGVRVVKPLPLADAYLVEWPQTRGAVENMASAIKADPTVAVAEPNILMRLTAVPNDTYYADQWNLQMINMPHAWEIEKGRGSVIVAVLDTGISLSHPDIASRLVPGFDVADMDSDPGIPSEGGSCASHGLFVAGVIAAVTDNNEGIAGVCWEGVKIMPIKIFSDADIGPGGSCTTPMSNVVEGLDYAMKHGAKVVNMSFGAVDGRSAESAAERAKCAELAKAGIILVAAAGNDGQTVDPKVNIPAAHDGVIAVTAVNSQGTIASYSSYGREADIAAPGGEMVVADDPGGITSLFHMDGANGYARSVGTSFAAPHVAAAAALLLSAGLSPSEVEDTLKASAKRVPDAPVPSDFYGWGILDVYEALKKSALIDIKEPTNGQKVNTSLPRFKAQLRAVSGTTLNVYLGKNIDANGDGIPDDATEPIISSVNVANYYDPTSKTLQFQLVQPDPNDPAQPMTYPTQLRNPLLHEPLEAGAYRLCVEAAIPGGGAIVKSVRVFFVEPKIMSAGMSLMSVPYPLHNGDGDPNTDDVDPRALTRDFLGVADEMFYMARWAPSTGSYALFSYDDLVDDPRATLFPPDAGVRPRGSAKATPPAGLGFWLHLTEAVPILPDGIVDDLSAYDIPVVSGWNMIGDPFPFNVDWSSVMVTYQGSTRTITDAVTSGWLRPALYRYNGTGYSYESLPSGTLIPWEGNWVRALKGTPEDPVVLSIPPLASHVVTRSASQPSNAQTSRSTGNSRDDWSIKLAVQAGNAFDNDNVIGCNSRSTDGYDLADIDTPPMLKNFVDLSFPHPDWGDNRGYYTRDIRSPAGASKTWQMEVTTDIPNTDVRLTWPDISSAPKEYDLILEDIDSSKRVFMRTRGAYTYNSGSTPGRRRFKLSVDSAVGSRLILSNVDVVRTRGSGVTVSYSVSRDANVEVRVHNGLRRLIRTVGGNETRSAGIGAITWDGRTADGSPVDRGLYILEVVATDPNGQIAKVVRPYQMAR